MQKVLIVEDDVYLSSTIKERLEKYHFIATEIGNFQNMMQEFSCHQPDLVLLDINLPYYDGYTICKEIREKSLVPILIISARKEEMEQIRALELGADDYLIKPFTMEMLLTKVKVLLRRANNQYTNLTINALTVGRLILHTASMEAEYLGTRYPLTKNECNLLQALMLNANKFVNREDLIEAVWDEHTFIEDNTLTVNISRIRRLLLDIKCPAKIESKRGVGYRLIDDSSQEVRNEN